MGSIYIAMLDSFGIYFMTKKAYRETLRITSPLRKQVLQIQNNQEIQARIEMLNTGSRNWSHACPLDEDVQLGQERQRLFKS